LTVICSDKTGTLTKNEMTAVQLRTAANLFKVTGVGYAPTGTFTTDADAPLTDTQMGGLKEMLAGLLLCNDSQLTKNVDQSTNKEVYTPMGAPTEVALITVSQKAGLNLSTLSQATPRIGSVPFESEHKFMATVHQEADGKRLLLVKGAPDRLMPMCTRQVVGDSLTGTEPFDREFWSKAQAELSSQGLRVLALCRWVVGGGVRGEKKAGGGGGGGVRVVTCGRLQQLRARITLEQEG
jgi:magnesium-transporting ATPase (P-type)